MAVYRYEEPTPDTGGYCCGECGREGRYVPAEPDYGAAKRMLLHRLDVYEIDDDQMLADDVIAIVDAALGGVDSAMVGGSR